MSSSDGKVRSMPEFELELRDQLRTNPAILDLLEAGILDGIWYWDIEDPDRGWLSPSFWRTLGHDPDDPRHQTEDVQDLVHPEDRQHARRILEAQRTDPTQPYDQIVRFRHRQGHWVWLRCRGVAVRVGDRPIRMLGTHTDVTMIHERAEERLAVERERREDLEEAYRNLAQFASFASHDLQAPLRTISGFLSLLADKIEGQLDEESRDWMGRIRRSTERMQQLIDRLLVYSRSQNRQLETERIAVRSTLEQVIRELGEDRPDHQAEFEFGELPTVVGDGKMVFQLFENLIGNSIKYRGEAPPRIAIGAYSQGGRAWFTVADNGIGIAQEHHQSVFEAFRRLHSQQKIEGSGLGLAIVKKIVERHGGRVHLESEPGQGTRVHFSLPLAARQAPDTASEESRS